MIVLSSFICCVWEWECVCRVKCAAGGTPVLLPPLASFQTENKREIQFTFFFSLISFAIPVQFFHCFSTCSFLLGAIRFAWHSTSTRFRNDLSTLLAWLYRVPYPVDATNIINAFQSLKLRFWCFFFLFFSVFFCLCVAILALAFGPLYRSTAAQNTFV